MSYGRDEEGPAGGNKACARGLPGGDTANATEGRCPLPGGVSTKDAVGVNSADPETRSIGSRSPTVFLDPVRFRSLDVLSPLAAARRCLLIDFRLSSQRAQREAVPVARRGGR